MAQKIDSLIDLSTKIPDRQFFTLDGEKLYFRNREELSIRDAQHLQVKLSRHIKLVNADKEITEKQAKEINGNLDAMLQIMVADPPKHLSQLSKMHKEKLVDLFFDRYLPDTTSAARSRGSSDSTEEASGNGSA